MRPKLEVCVDSIESVLSANSAQVDRIELCSALDLGGLTPSVGFLQYVKKLCPTLETYVMIRPRAADFNYSDHEIEMMRRDIEIMKSYGAYGFVFGVLKTDGNVDIKNCQLLLESAAPLPSTFHRAFDVTNDPYLALEDIINLGFTRILTSGIATNAYEGVKFISELVELAADRIIIMPGSGINEHNLDFILKQTRAKEFHSSASISRQSNMAYHNANVSMGAASNEYNWKVTCADKVDKLMKIAKNYNV